MTAKGPNERMSEADKKRFERLFAEYEQNAHGVQSGIAMRVELDRSFASHKDLRVGIDTSKADMGGLVELLIQKGVFTDIEYMEAIVRSMAKERERWEADISELLGRTVTLG